MRLNLGAPAAIVELEGGVEMPIRAVGVDLASGIPVVAHDGVTKRLQGKPGCGPEETERQKAQGSRDKT